MMIELRGGVHDGLEMEISGQPEILEIASGIKALHGYAEPVTPTSTKRHSWDDDALTVLYDRYRKTGIVTINGQTVYELESMRT